MTSVLAVVDDSPVCLEVVQAALGLSAFLGTDLRVLHVGEPLPPVLQDAVRDAGAELETRPGAPVPEIRAALGASDVLLGVMGARGAGTGKRPAGSTALAVLRQTDKPVLVVPPGAARVRVDRLVVPLDGTAPPARAMEAVLGVFLDLGVDVVAVHVFDATTVPAFWDQPHHASAVWSQEFLARYCDQPGVRLHLCSGNPGERVLDLVESEGADVLALSWSQDLAPGRARTLRHVLSDSPVPVLLVPVLPPAG